MMLIDPVIKDRIRRISFFSHGDDTYIKLPFKKIESWNQARQLLFSIDWENTQLEGRNEFSTYIAMNYPDEDIHWNAYVQEARSFLESEIIDKEIAPFAERQQLPVAFLHSVRWDLLNGILYEQYKMRVGENCPDFCGRILNIYEAGYFPCGWEGEYPENGQVIII